MTVGGLPYYSREWRRCGGWLGGGARVRAVRGGFGFSPFFYPSIITLVFFSLPLQVKPQKRKELCDGREGQTAYYVERKALRCGALKATLLIEL